MPSLRSSLFCGERFTLDQAHTWADAAPNSTLENLYGPTELTVTVTSYRLPRERADWPTTSNGSVPIGQVYPHLDSRIDPENGELQVRGSQRFFGYHDAEDNEGKFVDLTAAPSDSNSTVPGPTAWFRTGDHVVVEDGVLVHLGRLDHQVKIRGYRVELHEIETALRVWGGVDDAVVHAIAKANGQVELAAVCTGNVPAAGALRALLRPRLPAYMIPTRIVPLTRLPLNDRGKVDRTACAATLRGEYS
jgi:acyl-CoA synthetase (AMP-forming)/AMP-acid ligase II